MRFDKAKDPAAVAPSAKDAGRYSVAGVAVVTREGQTFLAATDGRALTLVRCHPDDGEQPAGVYPGAAFTAARRPRTPGSRSPGGPHASHSPEEGS